MAKKHPFALVEAFCTQEPGSGNPAGVVLLEEWPSDRVMQCIAGTVNQAETAFVGPDSTDRRIRWFTPTVEVRLCGHATLASAQFLSLLYPNEVRLEFESLSGKLAVARLGDRLELDFPAKPPEPLDFAPAKDLAPSAVEWWRDRDDWIAVFEDENAVADYQPNFEAIGRLGGRGLAITAQGSATDFVYRFFAPQSGVDEDHATGSAQTYLAPLWAKKLLSESLTSLQLSPRQGAFASQLVGDRIQIGGKARILIRGEIEI